MEDNSFVMNLQDLSREPLKAMAEAAREVVECHHVLAKTGDNIVSEVLPTDSTFYQFDHCPPGDIYDPESHGQYYYHAHRDGEHGHFHTFLREKGMPLGAEPVVQSEAPYFEQRQDKLCHLVAISMDPMGWPIGLFTTNRWITTENWYGAEDVCRMLEHFRIDLARPSWPTNRWVTSMIQLFRPQIERLLHERDVTITEWQEKHPDEDVFEDRRLDLPSKVEISLDEQIRAVQDALDTCGTGHVSQTG